MNTDKSQKQPTKSNDSNGSWYTIRSFHAEQDRKLGRTPPHESAHFKKRQIKATLCPLCNVRNVDSREHVLPKWFRKEFYPGDGPFTLRRGREITKRRDGSNWNSDHLPVHLMPICRNCNNIMNLRFESSQSSVLKFFRDENLLAKELRLVFEWITKTIILLHHPNTYLGGDVNLERNPKEIDKNLYSWMIDNSPPPDSVSCWIATTRRQTRAKVVSSSFQRFSPPAFSMGGTEYRPRLFAAGLGVAQDLVKFQVVYHPGCKLDHPMIGGSKVRRLSPTSASFCKNDLAPLSAEELHQFDRAWENFTHVRFLSNTNPLLNPWDLEAEWSPFDLTGVIGGNRKGGSL